MFMWIGFVSMLSIVTGSFYSQVLGEQTNTLAPCPHGKPEGHTWCEQDQHVSVRPAHNELPKHQGEEHQEVWACHGAKENIRGDVHPVPPSSSESWAHLCRPKPIAHGCCSYKIEDRELLYWQLMTDFMVSWGLTMVTKFLGWWDQNRGAPRYTTCVSSEFWQSRDNYLCTLYSSSSNYVLVGHIGGAN